MLPAWRPRRRSASPDRYHERVAHPFDSLGIDSIARAEKCPDIPTIDRSFPL